MSKEVEPSQVRASSPRSGRRDASQRESEHALTLSLRTVRCAHARAQVMHFLNELYETFDALAEDYDMYKLGAWFLRWARAPLARFLRVQRERKV